MSGLLLISVAAVWIWISANISKRVSLIILKHERARAVLTAAICLPISLLPVCDEIIGGIQFTTLCRKDMRLEIDAEHIRGRRVTLEINPSNELVRGQLLRTLHSHYEFRDEQSNLIFATYDTYAVYGGWLMRFVNSSESALPLLLPYSSCAPPGRGMLDKRFGFQIVN